MKRTFLLILMVMATTFSASLLGHETTVVINTDNSASVTERYVLSLTDMEKRQFENISNTNVNSLIEWQTLSPEISIYVLGNASDLQISTSQASGGQFGSEVKLEYNIQEFSTRTVSEGRYEYYNINGDKFKYYNTGTFNIGVSSDLTITLPSTIKSTDIITVSPAPWFSGANSFRWISGTRTNNFIIQYRKEIAISESFDIARLVDTYFFKKPLYGLLITATVLLSIFYRKQISELISESFTSEEEIQLPKK